MTVPKEGTILRKEIDGKKVRKTRNARMTVKSVASEESRGTLKRFRNRNQELVKRIVSERRSVEDG